MSLLEKYGKKLIEEEPEILSYRKLGIINNYSQFSFELLKKIINDINIINIEEYTYYIKHNNYSSNDEMKWSVYDNLNELNYNSYPINQPKYTLIICESNYGIHFQGGKFHFVDKIIEPKRGSYIFFDSREPYKLEKIKLGSVNTIVVKFYS